MKVLHGSLITLSKPEPPQQMWLSSQLEAQIGNNVFSNLRKHNVSELTKETQYSFAIFPFNGTIGDNSTYDYKTDGTPPSITLTTIPTLGEWGMIAFGSLLLVFGGLYIKRVI